MAREDFRGDPETPAVSHPGVQGMTDDELEALEDAEDLRIGLERLRRVKTEGTVSWESVKAKHGL